MGYDNTDKGVLFRNDQKEGNQPDYKGSINIDGKEYWLSSWLKKDKKQRTYMSLAVTPK